MKLKQKGKSQLSFISTRERKRQCGLGRIGKWQTLILLRFLLSVFPNFSFFSKKIEFFHFIFAWELHPFCVWVCLNSVCCGLVYFADHEMCHALWFAGCCNVFDSVYVMLINVPECQNFGGMSFGFHLDHLGVFSNLICTSLFLIVTVKII